MACGCNENTQTSSQNNSLFSQIPQTQQNQQHQQSQAQSCQLARQVYETGFAIDDILLYLDTHPEDTQAMAYYQRLCQLYQNAIQMYEQAYGPLSITQITGDIWNWIQNPWPWEGGAN